MASAPHDTRQRKGLIARWIERRFGGYRHAYAPIDEQLPERAPAGKSVAIVGSGLAGLGAACKLAARGFAVSLFERNDYIGGKLGAWKTTMPDGREIGMSHGFHAFFHHYYNLNAFFAELGIDRHYANIGDYLILTADGRSYSFKDIATTPILNLLSLARHGVYNLREVAGRTTGAKMEALLRYDPATTFAEYDEISYAQFAEDAKLPASLKLVFNTFARAFFSDAEKMSMAELIKSFHFYYLSNDGGLIYEYLDDDYEQTLLAPLRAHLSAHGATLHTGCEIGEIAYADGRFRVGPDGQRFDYLVVASDVLGTRELFRRSPSLTAACPETADKVETLRSGQRYAVLRLWLDRSIDRELPGFIITERAQMLDAVTFVHQVERESADWVAERAAQGLGGGVIEAHCYAVPEQLPDDQDQLERMFIDELATFFPELRAAEVVHKYMYVRRDFPGFHVGKHATRPSWDTQLPNLFLAGDWVVLPFPSMLMEAAYTAGLMAANAICEREGVRQTPVWTVPPRGFMAGMPKRPF
jgi:isorenieratene synthase